MGATVRKLENNLITLGTGTIVLGVWTFIKYVLTFFLIGMDYGENLTQTDITILSVMLWMFISADLLIRLFIGFSARLQGKGKKKRLLYVIAAGLVFTTNLVIVVLEVISLIVSTGKLELLISLVIDVSAQVLLMDLFVSSIKLRTLQKSCITENGGEV